MKGKFTVAFMMVILMACAYLGYTEKETLREGKQTPQLIVGNNDSTINLKSLYGKYVLVDFWSSADADSRLKSYEYSLLSAVDNGRIQRISVNFDRSRKLFEEIVNRDRLDSETQFHVDGAKAGRIRSDFKLEDGYKSFLIGPNGRIVAINPEASYIERIFM